MTGVDCAARWQGEKATLQSMVGGAIPYLGANRGKP